MIEIGQCAYIGEMWLAVAKRIMQLGKEVTDGIETYKEIKGVIFSICNNEESDDIDMVLKKYGDIKKIQWMKSNFELFQPVKELHNANSYASRLYKYGGKKNQIQWVIDKINEKKSTRSATITMLEPLTDFQYIPCISLIDFDVNDRVLDVYVYARALDFGGKAYANMICIKELLTEVSKKTNCKMGNMNFVCKSVHIYNYEYDDINRILKEN